MRDLQIVQEGKRMKFKAKSVKELRKKVEFFLGWLR